MEFLKWTLKESMFHYAILLTMFIITLFWSYDTDTIIARTAIGLIFVVLVVGKYQYWKRLKKNRLL